MSALKEEYNKLIVRQKKADKFFEGKTYEQCKKWIEEYQNIIVLLSCLMGEYEIKEGHSMSDDEILNGFKEV